MTVLVGCEESQEVCKAFRARGHEAYSCDLQPCSGGHPEWHIKGDVIDTLWAYKWDIAICHPPCTRIANSGVRWIKERNLWTELKESIELFREIQNYASYGYKVAIENPIPHKYAVEGFFIDKFTKPKFISGIGKYSQIIHPWQFGHGEQKSTCLWLSGLPLLQPTDIVSGRKQVVFNMAPSKDRAKLRSKTYPGIGKSNGSPMV